MYDEESKPTRRSTEQLNEDMESLFTDEGSKEDFSLSKLSSPAAVSAAPWSPGYSEDSQVREADDPRIRDTDINGKFSKFSPMLSSLSTNIHDGDDHDKFFHFCILFQNLFYRTKVGWWLGRRIISVYEGIVSAVCVHDLFW